MKNIDEKISEFFIKLFFNILTVIFSIYFFVLIFSLSDEEALKISLTETDLVGVFVWLFFGSIAWGGIFLLSFYFFSLIFQNVPSTWKDKILLVIAAVPTFFMEDLQKLIGCYPAYNQCFFAGFELLIVYIPCLFLYFLFQKQIQAQMKRFSSFWGRVFFGE